MPSGTFFSSSERFTAITVTPEFPATHYFMAPSWRPEVHEQLKWLSEILGEWTHTMLELKKPQRSLSTVFKMPFHKLTILILPKSSI